MDFVLDLAATILAHVGITIAALVNTYCQWTNQAFCKREI
jgi:hypothetical protein